jgi:hypothetical protein
MGSALPLFHLYGDPSDDPVDFIHIETTRRAPGFMIDHSRSSSSKSLSDLADREGRR